MAEMDEYHEYLPHDILLDVANQQLYRENAFRVLGLPVTADGAEIGRHHKKLKMLAKLGGEASRSHSCILPLTPRPDSDAIRKAGQRLHDMQSRLVDELFWFWPASMGRASDGDGYALLEAGDVSGAHRAWAAIASCHPDYLVARHNLAVMHHALALDIECRVNAKPNVDADRARLDHHWKVALRLWARLATKEALWAHVESRAETLEDPRLTSDFIRRMRESLPAAILSISINFAVRAAKRGDKDHARRHLIYIRDSGADQHLASSILEREAASLVEQVRRICEPIPDRSKAAPEKADQLAKSVLTDCRAVLTGIRAILGKDHHLRQTAFDLVAATVRECMIDYGNATENWGGCVSLLEHAAGLALDEQLQSRLRDDVAQVKENRAGKQHVEELKKAVTADRIYEVTIHGGQVRMANICTCCLGPPTEVQPVSYEWEETRGLTRYKRSLTFKFPVCAICSRHQAEYSQKRAVLVLLAAGISTGIAFLVAGTIPKPEWLPFVIGGGLVTVAMAFALSAMIRLRALPEQHACRDQAVEMPTASDSYVVFRFHHPLYAEAFARSNNVTVREHQMRKPTRGSYILAGRGTVLSLIVAVVIGVAGQSFIYAVKEDNWRRSAPSAKRSSPATSPRTHTSPRSVTPAPADSGLSRRIDTGRSRTEELETEMGEMDSELESLSTNIERYKREIQDYEADVESGMQVDQDAYEEVVEDHNRCVKQYNLLLESRNAIFNEYESEVDSVNDMVRRYNRGDR